MNGYLAATSREEEEKEKKERPESKWNIEGIVMHCIIKNIERGKNEERSYFNP